MVNKNIKHMLLFVTLCILLIGIVSATDVESNDTTDTTPIISEKMEESHERISNVKENVINNNKEIKTDLKAENVKTTTNKVKTKITIDPIPKVQVDDSVFIMGNCTDINNKPLKDTPIKLDVNGEPYITYTDDYGFFIGEYFANTPGKKTVTVSFAGNNNYAASTAKTTFNVTGKATTYININTIQDTTIGNTIKITGRYYYSHSISLTYTNMTFNINGVKYYNKTDANGYFSYSYKTNKEGTNKVTVSYPGNTKFKAASSTTTFNVKPKGPQYTYITLNNIPEVSYGSYTTINGHYYYGNNIPLTYTTMTININGEKYNAKTDNTGYFSYNYKTDRVGKNTVTVSYHGNNNFKAASATKTFNVKITSPIYTYITLNNIKEVKNGEYTTINGHYYYSKNIPLTSTRMTININGQKYYAKTDNNGYFSYNYKTNRDGRNTVTISYPGNNNFKAASSTTTFNVKSNGPQYTYITLNNIPEVSYGSYTTINGHYYYGNNIPLTYTTMTININGDKYTAKTDNTGYFSYYYKTEKVGKNTVTVSYHGNNNFKAASATKTFNVKITSPIYTYIYLYNVDDVKLGEYTTISGYYEYGNGYPLTQTTMTININGQKYTTKTDNNGYFKYNYKTSKVGTNTVTVSYPGNTNFYGDSCSTSFTVLKNYDTLELNLNTYTNEKFIENDVFCAWYQTVDGQWYKGAHVEVYDYYADFGDAPNHLIMDATFYFKNSAGKIISRQYDDGNGVWMSHDLISGYTPYKVVCKYRKMTLEEKNLWNSGYIWNPKTDTWYPY